ncbi:MAG: YibE/F family protein [Clostridia bacterium]|nr:YibE/F family protein [Clostridia bacterium]
MQANTKRTKFIHFLIYLLTVLLSVAFIFFGNKVASGKMDILMGDEGFQIEKAKVTEIVGVYDESLTSDEKSGLVIKDIAFKAVITTGDLKGDTVVGIQNLNSYMMVLPKEVSVGDKILIYNVHNDVFNTDWVYGEYIRTDALMVLGAVFVILLLIFGGFKGLQTLVSLAFTVLAIFVVFVPSILSGFNIYRSAIIICVYITVMTLIIVSGVNRKTVAAIIGCIGGITVAALLVVLMDGVLNLTGLVNEESAYLLMLNLENPIDLKGVFFGAILIGAMGAIMDVAMSISSSLFEIMETSKSVGARKLVKSGMTIGRDIMGTMSNTLILAYIGSSLSIVLLLITYNPSLLDLLNREIVVIEILQALVGSMGILFTIPLTAIASGLLYTRK